MILLISLNNPVSILNNNKCLPKISLYLPKEVNNLINIYYTLNVI